MERTDSMLLKLRLEVYTIVRSKVISIFKTNIFRQ